MQKVLFSMILALLLALTLVGMKRAFAPSVPSGTSLLAIGAAPVPPIPGRY